MTFPIRTIPIPPHIAHSQSTVQTLRGCGEAIKRWDFFSTVVLFVWSFFHISNAKELYDNDTLFVAFVKDPLNFGKYCEAKGFRTGGLTELMSRYESALGIGYLLRENWHCANIGRQFERHEQRECQKFRKYLFILYEFVFRAYAGCLVAVKPMFYFGKMFAYSTLAETVESLAAIWKFYFMPPFGQRQGHKLGTLFVTHNEPKLFNEDALKYAPNLDDSNETLGDVCVQVAFESRRDNQANEAGIKLIRHKFGTVLMGMLKEALRRAKVPTEMGTLIDNGMSVEDYDRLLALNSISNVQQQHLLFDEAPLIAFLRGQHCFDQLYSEARRHHSLLGIIGQCANREEDASFDQCNQLMCRDFESKLSLLYLMKKRWAGARIKWAASPNAYEMCERFRHYLDILYEYLLAIYATAQEQPTAGGARQKMPALRPLFKKGQNAKSLASRDVIGDLHQISKICFASGSQQQNALQSLSLRLVNESALRHFYYHARSVVVVGDQLAADQTLRQEFENKLEALFAARANAEDNVDLQLEQSPFLRERRSRQ